MAPAQQGILLDTLPCGAYSITSVGPWLRK
jgi:hypothetical protein